MLKLFGRFRPIDWLVSAFLVGFVVAQVYFDVTLPDYTAKITEEMLYNPAADVSSILGVGVMMLLYAGGSVASSIVVSFFATYLAAKFSQRLRRAVFSKVQSFSFEETNKFSTASLITRSTNDISQVQMAIMMIFKMAIAVPVTIVWAILKINASNGTLTWVSALWIGFLVLVISLMFLFVLPKFKLMQTLTDKLNGVTRENLTGLRVVKAYNADAHEEAKFAAVNKKITGTNLFVNRLMGMFLPLFLLVLNGISLTVYWLGAQLINDGSLDVPTMMQFTGLVMQVLMSFMMLIMLFIIVPRASVAARRINQVLYTKLSVTDPPENSRKSLDADGVGKGEVEFKNVAFKYPGASEYVLKNVSFKVGRGQTAAVIGSTGSGKSTLINLVPRFYDATEGAVLVDGVDVKDVAQSDLRARIGYVPQKGMLFTGTVSDNIAFGKELSAVQIAEAARVACADGFVSAMEEKYDSPISQGGKNVSGGQRQRLSIARAVAANPEIYIFDDSFSALDYKTDRLVRENLKSSTAGATSLIVAQRIGTIMDADLIVVLENGEIAGMGRHKELLETCAVYREIALSQLSAEELGIGGGEKDAAAGGKLDFVKAHFSAPFADGSGEYAEAAEEKTNAAVTPVVKNKAVKSAVKNKKKGGKRTMATKKKTGKKPGLLTSALIATGLKKAPAKKKAKKKTATVKKKTAAAKNPSAQKIAKKAVKKTVKKTVKNAVKSAVKKPQK